MAIETTDTPSEPVLSDLLYQDATPATDLPQTPETDAAKEAVETTTSAESEQSGEVETTDAASEQEEAEPADYEVTVDGESQKVTRSELIKGYQRQADYTKKTQAAAELRKQAETKLSQADAAIQVIGDIESEVNALIMGDVKNIDWDELRVNDTAEFLRLKEVVAGREKTLSDLKAKRDQLIQQKTVAEGSALHKALGWSDAAKRQADIDQITGYMQEQGITEQVTSHKLMLAIAEAAKYRKLQLDKVEVLKEVKTAPKTTKPVKVTKEATPKQAVDLLYG